MTTESIETKQYDDPAKIEPMQRESLGQVTGLCFIDTPRDKVTPIKLLDVWMGHRRMEEDQGREEGGGTGFWLEEQGRMSRLIRGWHATSKDKRDTQVGTTSDELKTRPGMTNALDEAIKPALQQTQLGAVFAQTKQAAAVTVAGHTRDR
ncbi:hypothetical protein RRG08_008428 [Elysia crispata]|uniref:Uncharacterized protein n=1 Tax=Elysia crispata TaxID=231223 RepID=A0AAE1DGA5_9GAST|nr:hypothetical protein RRG08_008428 [Elysia crispata]